MLIKGFSFGFLLQLAIGPVCLFILKIAVSSGILTAEAGVIGVTLIDGLYITLAILGIGSLMEKPNFKTFLKYFGALILLYFGLEEILVSLGVQLIPTLINTQVALTAPNAFITSVILTASNPITIIFWTGVFSTKITTAGFSKREMLSFGFGTMLSTLVFLGTMALVMGSLHFFIPKMMIEVLNIIVGVVLVGFGVKNIVRKEV